MPKYKVKWLEEAWVEVEADSEEEAKSESQRYLIYINRRYTGVVPNTIQVEEKNEDA